MRLRDLLAVVWKRRLPVAVVLLAAVAGSVVFALTQPKRYESTATIVFTPDPVEGVGLISSDSLSTLLSTYAATARSQVARQRAASLLGRPLPGSVDASASSGPGVMTITGRAGTPADAATTARAATDAFLQRLAAGKAFVHAELTDPPRPPGTAVQPRPPLIVGAAIVLGLAAGLLLALALEYFRSGIATAEDIAELTSAPVLGQIPRARAGTHDGSPLLVWNRKRLGYLQDCFRALRTNLDFMADLHPGALQVTSPEAGAGKSTVVANLGIAFSQLGIDTIIVDADLERSRQHRIFGLRNEQGLTTLMAAPGAPCEPAQTRYPHLRVITSGPAVANPIELLHVHFAETLRRILPCGSLVLIDSMPLLPVDGARLIATHAGHVLMVVAAGEDTTARLKRALGRLDLTGAAVVGMVLNKARRSEHESSYGPLA